jgi:UDP-N-acetylglucosamine/UDP-N-acetylgalactosamine diphosphorylase
MFIFDALAFAQRYVTLEVDRAQEFAPVKNSDGADSPETARRAMCARHRAWLARALGTPVSDEALVEISPLRALEAEEFLRSYRPPSASVEFPLYIA